MPSAPCAVCSSTQPGPCPSGLLCPAGDRQQLWAEKVGMVQPFAGNDATAWGNAAEPRALEAYQAVTGQRIANCMFQGGWLSRTCAAW